MEQRTIRGIDIGIIGAMLATSFIGVAAAEFEWAHTRIYWSIITVLFGIGAFALVWVHRHPETDMGATALKLVAHWLGVLVAVQLKFFLVIHNQITEGEAGLSLSLVLALGTFLAGVYLDWRLIVVGVALAIVAPLSALVQQNILFIIVIGVAALAIVLLGDRVRRRFLHSSPASGSAAE